MSDRGLLAAVYAARAAVLNEGAAAGIFPGVRYRGRRTAKRLRLMGEVDGAAAITGVEIRLDRLAPLGWTYERLVARHQREEGDPIGYLLADRHRKPLSYKLRRLIPPLRADGRRP